MVSRRDQLQAYRFMTRRSAGALLRDDSDTVEAPLRRLSGGATASVVVALLVVAVVGLFGLFSPGGSTSWQDGRSLILEEETGTRYVYLSGVLHPVLNYASARLVLRGGDGVVQVSRNSLAGTPHGAPVGIPGAPDSVPTTATLLAPPWTVCSLPATDQTGQPRPVVRVGAGSRPAGEQLPAGSGVLIRTGAGQFLVWNGKRLSITPGTATVLGYTGTAPVPVGDAWANVVPQVQNLQAPAVPGIGAAGPSIGTLTTTVGQVFQAANGTGYVMYPDGLAPVSPLQLQLLRDSPATTRAYHGGPAQAIPLTAQQLTQARTSASSPATTGELPAQPPRLIDTSTSAVKVCAAVSGATVAPTITTAPATAQTVTGSPAVAVDALDAAIAGEFDLAPGHGAVVREVPEPGVTTGTLYLITDLGIKYAIAGASVLDDLGLKGVAPTPLPAGMLKLFPTGPTLDEQAAARTVPVAPNVAPSTSG